MGIYSTRIDITGNRYGRLLVLNVIEPDKTKKKKALSWNCLCDCGNEKIIMGTSLKVGETTSCGCFRKELHSKLNWDGCGEMSGTYFCSIRIGAEQRLIEFNITKEEVWNLFLKQGRKCAYTGEILTFRTHCSDKKSVQTASLDRINSSEGYHIDNMQWIHKDINFMKSDMTHSKFLNMCKKITEYSKYKVEKLKSDFLKAMKK